MKIGICILAVIASTASFSSEIENYLRIGDHVEVKKDFRNFYEKEVIVSNPYNGPRKYAMSYKYLDNTVKSRSGKTKCTLKGVRYSDDVKVKKLDAFYSTPGAPLKEIVLLKGDNLKVVDVRYKYKSGNPLALFDLDSSKNQYRLLLENKAQRYFYIECNGKAVSNNSLFRRDVKIKLLNNIIEKL